MSISAKFRPWLGPVAIAAVVSLIGWFLHAELRHYRYRDIVVAWHALPRTALGIGGALTALSYLLLMGYDALALAHLERRLGALRTAFASFTAFVVTNNVGLGALGSGAVRLRLYGAWGLTAGEVLSMQAIVGSTFWLGLATTAGITWLVTGGPAGALWGRVLGGVLLLGGAGYVVLCARWRTPIAVWRWTFTLPRPRLALGQLLLGTLDITVAGSVLWVLLPAGFGSWGGFLALYTGALATAVISHVPGGLGVLETIVLMGRPDKVPANAALAGLVAFRVIYYLIPLGLAVLGLAAFEGRRHRAKVGLWASNAGRWLPVVAPRVLAIATFMGGALLLFSGATPSVRGRMAWLNELLPLPIIETSHLLGSIAGVGLLVLARGLQRRIDAAYGLTLGLLATGIVASLLKGFDWEEASALTVMLVALAPCRGFFNRHSALRADRFSPGWMIAILAVVGMATWLGFFAYRHVEYRDDLWWRFSPHADAPRFLRAQLLGFVVLGALGLQSLLRPTRTRREASDPVPPETLARLVAQAPTTVAQLVFTGDKEVIVSSAGTGFVMFGRAGRSWVAMGDPVTRDEEVQRELVWRLRERADRAGGRAVFYQVRPENLATYLDAGFGLTKIGEEARVPLTGFSLAGGSRKSLRSTVARLEREGVTFGWIEAAAVEALLPELQSVSDAWLEAKSVREKGFSLGFFDAAYLQRNPVVLVRQGARLVAFANIWVTGDREELSVDLMRHTPDAPSGVMDFLFVKLMQHGAAAGFRWFNLGMAPLAGMESHALAPISHRIGRLIFRHADHFYGFQGLRAYKDKFDPVWEPRYLAVPGAWNLPAALTDITSLISGGLRGVFAK